jgi:hypothetical protein
MGPNLMGSDVMSRLRWSAMFALIFSSTALSQETISSKKDLGLALERAVTCKVGALGFFDGSEFAGGPGDAMHQLKSLGVNIAIKNEDYSGGIRYRFPLGIKVFGYEAIDALYFSESTTLFVVTLRADFKYLPKINKVLNLTPVPKGNPEGYGYVDNLDVRYIRKLREPGVDFPYTIFSGIEGSDGHNNVAIGCQNLAW